MTWAGPVTLHRVHLAFLIDSDQERTRLRLNAIIPEHAPWTVGWARDEYGRVTTCTEGWRAK